MIPKIAFVLVGTKMYEVNTISMGMLDEIVNPGMSLRNAIFGIDHHGETMIWEVDIETMQNRKEEILHCQRYRTHNGISKGHANIVRKMAMGDTSFFNGDGFEGTRMGMLLKPTSDNTK